MSRALLVTIHMYLSSFFAPAVLLVAISGGLYLVGIKGEVIEEPIYSMSEVTIDTESATLKSDVLALLGDAGVTGYSFEYVKVKGDILYTRPTSTGHYMIRLDSSGATVIHAQPSLQKRMIELHMGHGPTAFKTFQKFFAAGLLFIILSGLWLGISSAKLRTSTVLTLGAGAVVFGILLL